jgi:deoxyadenosine/deoxycytidine kinase
MKYSPAPKLIVVDGLSGSGKTTTCRWLAQHLHEQHLPTRAVYEADVPHPLHWWQYWDGHQHLAPDFDQVTSAQYMQTSIEKWTQFIDHLHTSDDIVVIEGVVYCLAVWFFLQGDVAPAQIATYIQRVEAIMAPIAPLLVYLRQDSIATHTRTVWSSRGSALEQELIRNMERTRYFRHRQLRGFAGVIALWEDTQALTDTLFATHRIPKLVLEITPGDWDSYYTQIRNTVVRGQSD